MFSTPVSRAVEPSDIKFSIERLFQVDSGGVGFFTGIEGANAYAKSRKGGISGIVADDKTHTITFHLTQPDGTFLDYMATPFAFAMPKGTPYKDISTAAGVADRHRPLPDHRLHAPAVDHDQAQSHLQVVDEGHPQRPSGRDRRGHRRDPRSVGQRDRPGQPRLVLRVGTAGPADRAQGPLPRPGVPVCPQQHDVLLHERAQVPVQQAGGAPGRQLRDRPKRAGEDLRRPGQPHREHPPARLRTRLQEAQPLPAKRGQGQAADPAGRGGRRPRGRVGPHHAAHAQRRPVPGRRAQLDRAGGHRQDVRRVGLLGHARDPEGRPPDRVPGLEPGLPRRPRTGST